ncbi:alpha/beta hydrolase family protein [Amycolatopsis alkalitolerans]|uniref:S9 family peptidase n=1 Tax=Amycolatopsis alkalitolerans TaxID=2547244 RepID=A0A5C4M9T6_9PSEU|nr:S9 family peptidase [Amycolatopsis alkalitolerans]TNC29694.1 S9 family peptidase [Amycolatopsis alkalitolerans]
MTNEALTAELVTAPAPTGLALSPDGGWVAYLLGEDLMVVPVDRSAPPRKLAGGATVPRWAQDSVCFLSGGQLHRIALTGEAEQVTRSRPGIHDYLPLADPALIAVIAPEREDSDVRVWSEAERDRLWLYDLREGGLAPLGDFGDRHVVEVAQRPGGGPLAVLTWSKPEIDPGSYEPEVHLVEDGAVTNLGPATAEASSLTWRGPELAYLGKTPPGLVGGDAVFGLVPGEGAEHRNLTAGEPRCPVEILPDLTVYARGLDTWIGDLEVRGLAGSVTAGENLVAAVISTAYEPPEVYAGPKGGPLKRLSDTRPELREIRWGVQERLWYRASDGLALDGLLILPAGKSRVDGPFPLVTLVHGGPYGRYADCLQLAWYPSGQWLATAGYAVFLPNPRGGQGHGHEFAATVAGAVGLDEWTDIVAGIDLLVAEGLADPGRLGIGGWSHGGFVAAWAVGQTTTFKAALVGAGISDWGMLAATGQFGAAEAALAGSTGWEGPGPHQHDRVSPISYASRIRTPVLIAHGAADTNVPVSQAEFLHRALRHHGVEHEYVLYPRENHAIRERAHQIDLLHRMRAWFDRWL